MFAALEGWPCAIVGSSLRDFERAHDIDVLVPWSVDFRAFCRAHSVAFRGTWRGARGVRIRQVRLPLRGVTKPVQVHQAEDIEAFEDHPHVVLLRDGTRLHEGVHFMKPSRAPTAAALQARVAAWAARTAP